MKKILLPTDFSDNAWNAINYAISIFRNEPCTFYILNSYQVGSSGLMTKRDKAHDTRFFQLIKDESEKRLKKVLERIKSNYDFKNHVYKTLSISSNLTNAIGRTAYDESIDLIIMGTKGATGLKEVFLGSNTHKIIKRITFCPIIAVPDDFEHTNTIDTILVATGYEHLFESYEFIPLIKIANLFNSNILVLYAGDAESLNSNQKTAKKLIKKHLKSVEHSFAKVKGHKSINEAIQETVTQNENVHMVAMINYWHSFFEKITHEPVIKKVAFNTRVPFLVLHLFE